MRESRSYGSVGVRGGNEPLYPETPNVGIAVGIFSIYSEGWFMNPGTRKSVYELLIFV